MRRKDWSELLDPDERILWEGQPTQRLVRLMPRDIFLVPVSGAVFFGLSMGVVKDGIAFALHPFFLFIWLLATHVFIGRFVVHWLRRRSTHYAISNKRAYIALESRRKSARVQALASDTNVTLRSGRDGYIILGNTIGYGEYLDSMWTGSAADFRLDLLDDPQAIYDLIRKAQREAA